MHPTLISRLLLIATFCWFVVADQLQAYWKSINETCDLLSVSHKGQCLMYECSGELIYLTKLYDPAEADFIHISNHTRYTPGHFSPLIDGNIYITDAYIELRLNRDRDRNHDQEQAAEEQRAMVSRASEYIADCIAQLGLDIFSRFSNDPEPEPCASSIGFATNMSGNQCIYIDAWDWDKTGNCDTSAQALKVIDNVAKTIEEYELSLGAWCVREKKDGRLEGIILVEDKTDFSKDSCVSFGTFGDHSSGPKNDLLSNIGM